jgi:hypothetical protein
MTKKLLIPLIAAAALTVPAGAAAHDGWHHHHHHALFAKLSGTGTSFAGSSATAGGSIASDKLGTGTFNASIATNWASAQTRTGDKGTLACAPATATLTLTGASTANTTTANLTGKTCKWTPAGATAPAGSMFFGKDASVSATGAVANLQGTVEKAFLMQKSDGTVRGAVFAGFDMRRFELFAAREHDASRHTGDCDHSGDGD